MKTEGMEGYFIEELDKMPFLRRFKIAFGILFKNEELIGKFLRWMSVDYSVEGLRKGVKKSD